jgi:hypothetical protein
MGKVSIHLGRRDDTWTKSTSLDHSSWSLFQTHVVLLRPSSISAINACAIFERWCLFGSMKSVLLGVALHRPGPAPRSRAIRVFEQT